MKSDYEERREKRIERMHDLAAKNEQESTAHYNNAKQLGDMIPFGQPILVGHHSEGRHRAHIKKIDNNMRKSIEAADKAKYYEGRAEAAESGNAISSDDPNALVKLREKLAKMEQFQEMAKAINKIIRSKKPEAEKVELIVAFGFTEAQAQELAFSDDAFKRGIPSYKLTNNNANMKTVRDRIKHLENIENKPDEEKQVGNIRILHNASENRVQIFFPGKPSEETRKELKSSGFRWSPTVGAWQAYYSNRSKYRADQIVNAVVNPPTNS